MVCGNTSSIGRYTPCDWSFSVFKANLNANALFLRVNQKGIEITLNTHKNKHPLRSNTESYGCKTHWTDSDDGDNTVFLGRKLFYLPFSVQSLREILDKSSHVLILIFCFHVEKEPDRAPAASFFRFLGHTQLDIHTWYDSSEIVIRPS